MKIILTGATGFIGRRLARKVKLAYPTAEIIAVVKPEASNDLERSGRAVLAEAGIPIVEGDLLNRETLREIPKSPDLVFHLASCTDMGEKDHSINDVGTRNLIEQLEPLKPDTHVVFASTIAIHDNRPDYALPVMEDTPYPAHIANEYGRSKYRTLEYLKQLATTGRFNLSTVRVSGVYGENTRPTGLYDMVGKLCAKRSFITRINWPGRVAMIYVEDIADVFIKVSQRSDPRKYYEVIPVVEALNLPEMCAMVYAALGTQPPGVFHVPHWFWKLLGGLAARKSYFEAVLPHSAYNRLWQLFVLSNNEFFNQSRVLDELLPRYPFVRFSNFALKRYAREEKTSDMSREVKRA